MRPLLLALLCCLLTACTFVHAAPPPSQEAAESLYRAFALQDMVKKNYLEGISLAEKQALTVGDGLGMILLSAALLEGTHTLLEITYPPVLIDDLELAKAQYDTLIDISKRWIHTQELSITDVSKELDAVATTENLRRYSDHLLELGLARDDVEMMGVRLSDELRKVFASAE